MNSTDTIEIIATKGASPILTPMDIAHLTKCSGTSDLEKAIGITPMPILESTLDGKAIQWPYDPNALFLLYTVCSEHQRCCQIKSECAFGFGIVGGIDGILASMLPEGTGAASFCTDIGLDLEVYGNAFVELIRLRGQLIGLRRLPARTMYVTKQGGYVQWTYQVDGMQVITDFDKNAILHLKQPCPGGFHYSLPSWIGGEGMVELVQAAITYNASFFRNRAIPDYLVLAKNGSLGADARERIKTFFQTEFAGAENAHRALYVPANAGTEVEFKKLTEDRKDAQFAQMLDASRERIITAHGVPPRLLGIMTAGQLGGGGEVEAQLSMFEMTALAPRRRRLSEQLAPILKQIGISDPIQFRGMQFNTANPLPDPPETIQPIADPAITKSAVTDLIKFLERI